MAEEEKATSPGVRYYGIAAFVIVVVAFFAFRTLFMKDGKEGEEGKEHGHAETKGREKDKEKGKS